MSMVRKGVTLAETAIQTDPEPEFPERLTGTEDALAMPKAVQSAAADKAAFLANEFIVELKIVECPNYQICIFGRKSMAISAVPASTPS